MIRFFARPPDSRRSTPNWSALPPRLLRLGFVGGLVATAGGGSAFSAPAVVSENRPIEITLVRQSPVVLAGGEFEMVVRLGRSGPLSRQDTGEVGDLEVVASVFPPVPNRSEFTLTLTEPMGRLPLVVSSPVTPEPSTEVVLSLPIQDPAAVRQTSRNYIGRRNGVHPVVVELRERDGGPVRNRLVTHLIHLPETGVISPLLVAFVVPLNVPAPNSAATPGENGEQAETLDGLIQALEEAAPLPLALAPNPRTLDLLASSPGETAASALSRLTSASQPFGVLPATFVPIDLSAMIARAQGGEIDRQLAQGAKTLQEAFGRPSIAGPWVSDQGIDGEAVDLLIGRGFKRVVLPERLLVPVARQTTLTSPFFLQGTSSRLPALVSDDGLASHFGPGDQTLRAHRLLADLAVLFLDLPGAPRGAVVVSPTTWRASAQFFQTLRNGLAVIPVVRPAPLDTLFDTLPLAEVSRARPLVRRPVGTSPTASRSTAPNTELAEANKGVAALASILGAEAPAVTTLVKAILAAESAELPSGGQVDELNGVRRSINQQVKAIRIPKDRNITLTAREGSIPVTFQNDTGLPARVTINIDSAKLAFPGGASRTIVLDRLNTTTKFPVVARTSGSFPVGIKVTSPDKNLVVGQAILTVRSTAAPGLGLAISLGALGFLIVWWGRNLRRGRHGQSRARPDTEIALHLR